MANLSELTAFKTRVLNLIVNDRVCVDLIANASNRPLPAKDLLNKQIFMYDFVDETVTDSNVYVCLETDRTRTNSVSTGEFWLYVTVLCHKSLMAMKGQIRRDALAQRIDELFNGDELGVGKVQLMDSRRFKVPNNSMYFGRNSAYRVYGYNLGSGQF